MSEDSWISTKNAIPIVVGVNTTWLAVLTWYTTSRINELTCKVTKLEDENKKLNKQMLNQKKQHSLMKKIAADLKRHESAITELQNLESSRASNDKPKHKTGGKKAAVVSSETETETEETSESHSDSSSFDVDNMYKTLTKKSKKSGR